LGLLSLEICDFDSKQLSLPVAISACRAAPMGANPLGHTFKPLTLYDISIYTIYFSHPQTIPQMLQQRLKCASGRGLFCFQGAVVFHRPDCFL